MLRWVEVRLPPYGIKLVGKAFDRANPRVDAQFSAAYCAGNALVRRTSKLQHFAPAQVFDPAVRRMIERVEVDCRSGHECARARRRGPRIDDQRRSRLSSAALDIRAGFAWRRPRRRDLARFQIALATLRSSRLGESTGCWSALQGSRSTSTMFARSCRCWSFRDRFVDTGTQTQPSAPTTRRGRPATSG